MADVSVVVSACRGVGTGTGVALAEPVWREFKSELLHRAQLRMGPPVSANDGRWYHENGVEEQYLLVFGDVPNSWDGLRRDLGDLADRYGQDSIALLTGVPVFIGPDGREV